MRKLLGKVSVYLDYSETEQSSYEMQVGRNDYVILLTPKKDQHELESRGLPYNRQKDTETTLAHEFGHLIGRLLHSPMQDGGMNGEVEAWAIADKELPTLDKNEERAALGQDEEVFG